MSKHRCGVFKKYGEAKRMKNELEQKNKQYVYFINVIGCNTVLYDKGYRFSIWEKLRCKKTIDRRKPC